MQRARVVRRVGLGVVIVLVFLIALAVVAATGVVRQSFPQTSGEIVLNGLGAQVTVIRDAEGTPQIYADSADDLFRAQGFVAAQDRFFEMDFRRHVTSGRLSELVGSSGLDADKVIRTLGWRKVAEEELPMLAPTTRQYLNAYADGVNDYISRSNGDTSNMALEYVVLGQQVKDYKVERWTAADSLAWLKAMAWDLRSNYDDELSRARLGTLFSAAQLKIIYPDYATAGHDPILSPGDWQPGATPAASSVPSSLSAGPPRSSAASSVPSASGTPATGTPADEQVALAGVQSALDAIPATIGRGDGVGSNSFVVAGSRTTTGKPLLANDPHLSVSLPGIWYQTGLHCRTVSATCPFDVSGFSFAGLPGIVIGHNASIAWGFTNLAPDVSDFYLEKVTDNTYLRDGKQVPLETSTETIKVAGEADVELTVRRTVHGPIISDVISSADEVGRRALVRLTPQQDTYAVSLAWTGIVPSATADAIFALDSAQDFTQFRAAAAQFAVPSQNLIYADTAGHIGYQSPGLIPIRATSVPNTPAGYWPAPGWDSQYDWKGYVPFAQLPWTYDPPEGYVVTANQQVTSVRGGPFLTTDWDFGFRSQRIKDLVVATPKISPDRMRQIQLDTRNGFAPDLVKALLAVKFSADPETNTPADDFTQQAQQLLADWDFTEPADKSKASIRATYFNA
ncbi:MAG: penicillin acylase family protein, partial [Lapillicoccus sp.]